MSRKILFYCQHSIGIGHLVRSFALVNSLKASFQITLVSGGDFPKGLVIPKAINFIQLPPIGIDENNCLKAINSREPVHHVMKKRQKTLLQTYKEKKPDIFITEYFPFGKIQFLSELSPVLRLIKNSNKRIKVLCSLRDVLERNFSEGKIGQDFSIKVINEYYDSLLIHGDKNFIPLEETFPELNRINASKYYTGYVTAAISHHPEINRQAFKKIVLSAGGGKVAKPFIHKIISSFKKFGFGDGITLQVVTGPIYPVKSFKILQDMVKNDNNIILNYSVESLSEIWRDARLSISSGGYNTLMELISSGIPAIVSPYRNQTNSEQDIRSSFLNNMNLIKTMYYEDLNEKEIALTVKNAMDFKPSSYKIDLGGADKTRKILEAYF
jgi:predicted glycosyltransferase